MQTNNGKGRRGSARTLASVRKEPHTVMLTRATWKRLGVRAIELDSDRSELLERWILDRLDRYDRSGHDLAVVASPNGEAA
jgi:hypothetical protein